MYETVKLFDCQKMPQVVRDSFFDSVGDLQNDVYASWTVSEYAADIMANPGNYTDDDAIAASNVDAWLIEQGATVGEFVIISHWW